MDFTIDQYGELLAEIKNQEINIYGVKDWIEQKPDRGILLRHDVDRKADNAIKIARLENEQGIRSTFYFRIVPSCFKPGVIKEVHKLGHEIGYHYEDLSLAGGNYQKAIGLFEEHLQEVRKLSPVETIAMHGRVHSRYDNRDLWKKYDFHSFGISAEAFLSINYEDFYYFTDTGRSWNSSSFNLRDRVEGNLPENISSTDALIQFIKSHSDNKIAIVSHPERWDDNLASWTVTLARDSIFNYAKIFLKYFVHSKKEHVR